MAEQKQDDQLEHTAAQWGYGMEPWRPARGDERLGDVAREGKGYPFWSNDMMMMMMILQWFFHE